MTFAVYHSAIDDGINHCALRSHFVLPLFRAPQPTGASPGQKFHTIFVSDELRHNHMFHHLAGSQPT